jgi:hypothetical protein
VGLIIIAAILLGLIFAGVMKRIPFEDHFALPWAAGRFWLLEGINPYEGVSQARVENLLQESGFMAELPDQTVFTQPLLNLFFYLPFSLIPYPISRVIWMVFLTLMVGLIGYFSIKIAGWTLSTSKMLLIVLLLILWLPSAFVIFRGYLNPVIIFLILLGLQLLLNNQDTAAGFVLALTIGSLPISIFILVAIIIWSLSQRRLSVLTAFFSGVAFLIIISLLMLSSWPLDLLRVLMDVFQNTDWLQTSLTQLAGIFPGIETFLNIFLNGFLALYMLYLWITIPKKPDRVFIWKALIVLVVGFLLNLQSSIYLLLLLIPALILVFRFISERWQTAGQILTWILIFALSLGSWLFIIPDLDFSNDLPLPWLSIGLPLFVFVGMIWIRWWAIQIPRLPSEFS